MEPITNESTQQPVAKNAKGGKRLKPGGKRPWVFAGIVLAAYLVCCCLGTFRSTFLPNASIEEIPVGGLTVEEAAGKLAEEWPKRTVPVYLYERTPSLLDIASGVSVQDLEQHHRLTPAAHVPLEELGRRLPADPRDCVRPVFDRDHNNGFFGNGAAYVKSLFVGTIHPCLCLDGDAFDARRKAAELAAEFSYDAVDGSYVFDRDSLTITVPKDGRQVNALDLEKALNSACTIADTDHRTAVIRYDPLPAKALTAQAIHDTLAPEARNAGYDDATGTITPERLGGTFDVAAAQAALDAAAPGETVTVPADIVLPEVTAADLETALFRDVLGECVTPVSGSAGRVSNVRLSAAAFDGLVLNDGETLSYNQTTGQRTTAKGYQPAPAYLNGETVNEIGGGVCQTSSTLYLACLRANLQIVERHAHRYTPAYIPWGMDATVSWGGPDFQFANDTGCPVKIETAYADGRLTVRILGTNAQGTTTKITAETLSQTPWKTVYQDDPTLAPGAEKVKVTPYGGAVVKSYRNVYDAQGKLVSSRLEAESSYKVRDKVIARGPAKAETPPIQSETPPIPVETPEPLPPEDSGTILLPEEPI